MALKMKENNQNTASIIAKQQSISPTNVYTNSAGGAEILLKDSEDIRSIKGKLIETHVLKFLMKISTL